MKKYLLFIISMLCVSIGTWADVPSGATPLGKTGSYFQVDGTNITVHIETAGDFNTYYSSFGDLSSYTNVIFTGKLNADDLAKFNGFTNGTSVDFDLTGVALASGTSISSTLLSSNSVSYFLKLPATIPVTNNFLSNAYNLVAISVNGTTTSAYIKHNAVRGGEEGTLAKIPSGTETFILYTGGENAPGSYGTLGNPVIGNEDLKNLYPENFANCSPTTLDMSNVTAWNAYDFTTNFTNYQAVGGQATTNAERWSYVIDPTGRLSVTGAIDATRMEYIRKNFRCESIDLSGATFTPDASVLQVNSTLRSLTLPAGTTITDAIKSSLSAQCPDLLYIYSPTSTEQTDAAQTVPDYVFVVNGGGLQQAIYNEPKLCSSVYIKVESYNPLITADVDFGSYDAWDHAFHSYAYLDFSGANVTPEIMSQFTYANSTGLPNHRIILPDNWSYNDMASVASGKGGKLVALYSYDGTRLNIMGLNANYSETALADSRIVRSGTTAVDFIQGTYNNQNFGSFTSSMLAAINNAGTPASIKNASVSVSNVSFEMTFTNTNLTVIDLEGVNASSNALNVDACSSLTYLNLGGATVGNVDASVASMQSVNLLGTTINGNADFSNATSLQRLTVDTNITGALTATGCTNLMRISNTGTIGSIAANGTSGSELTKLSTFINSGTVGDVNLSYTALSSVNNTGTVGNFTATNCSSLTALSMAGTVNGDINLTDCDNLASLNVANATINNQGTSTGDIILTRTTATEPSSISDAKYSNIKDNITKANSGQTNLVIVPGFTPKEEPKQDVSVAGVTEDGCALTVTIGSGQTLTGLLKEYYHMLHNDVAVAAVTLANLSTLSICNLTVNGEITADDITTINRLTFNVDASEGVIWHDATLNLDGATLATGVSLATDKIANTSVQNIILPRGLDKTIVKEANLNGCTALNAAISLDAARTTMVGYVKTAGSLRTTLDQVPDIRINPWNYNCNIEDVTLSGKLLAKDIATSKVNLDAYGNYSWGANGGSSTWGEGFNNDSKLKKLDISDALFVQATVNDNGTAEDTSDDYVEIGDTEYAPNMTLANLGWSGITDLKMSRQMTRIPDNFLYNCKQINKLLIPYCYKTIGNGAFYLCAINWLTTEDSKGAEIDNGENTYTFSKNLKEIGNAPSSLDDSNGFPKMLDASGTPVFGAVNSGQVSDVYILRNGYEAEDGTFTPTKCYRGAFASGMTYGWGGFDGGKLYCREKYKNGSFLFTILHYPDQASLPSSYNSDAQYQAMEEAYTDITKQYTKKDQTGALDANGDPIPWPTFAELGRAYNQAIRGLVWNDWSGTYTVDSEGNPTNPDGNIIGGTINFDVTKYPDGVKLKDETQPTNISSVSGLTRFDRQYVGWHEFVLSKATYVAPDENVKENVIYRSYQDAQYYTFCVPFDMTPAEVLSLLGVPASTETVKTKVGSFSETNPESDATNDNDLYPQIYTLKSVVRTLGSSSSNSVQLTLCRNLAVANSDGAYTYWTPKNFETTAGAGTYESNTIDYDGKNASGSDVMIRGGYPYLIKAYLPAGTSIERGMLGKYVLSRYAFSMDASTAVRKRDNCYIALKGQTYDSYFARPYDKHLVRAAYVENNTTHAGTTANDGYATGENIDNYYYRFMGQFWDQYMPINTYYMYPADHKWYYNKTYTTWPWRPYTCIINACTGSNYDESASVIPSSDVNDSEGHSVFTENLKLMYSTTATIDDTNFPSNAARQYSIVFDDGDIMEVGEGSETTAIDKLDGVDILPVYGKVYNMNGQQVGNSLNGLPKGLYIINGKKVVVK